MVKPSGSSEERLREHPSDRFSGPEEKIDLRRAVADLKAEPSGQHGHKQINLFKHGPSTLALYHFEAGSKLDDHVVDGTEFIHVLSGLISVQTEEQTLDLPAQSVLRLAPGVRHNFYARQDSQALMMMCVQGPGSHT